MKTLKVRFSFKHHRKRKANAIYSLHVIVLMHRPNVKRKYFLHFTLGLLVHVCIAPINYFYGFVKRRKWKFSPQLSVQ